MNVVELGADSKRLLMEIRDRLPAAEPPPPSADFQPLTTDNHGLSSARLVAWLSPSENLIWKHPGEDMSELGWLPLYVRVEP